MFCVILYKLLYFLYVRRIINVIVSIWTCQDDVGWYFNYIHTNQVVDVRAYLFGMLQDLFAEIMITISLLQCNFHHVLFPAITFAPK